MIEKKYLVIFSHLEFQKFSCNFAKNLYGKKMRHLRSTNGCISIEKNKN